VRVQQLPSDDILQAFGSAKAIRQATCKARVAPVSSPSR
jgi:hypothetical protein